MTTKTKYVSRRALRHKQNPLACSENTVFIYCEFCGDITTQNVKRKIPRTCNVDARCVKCGFLNMPRQQEVRRGDRPDKATLEKYDEGVILGEPTDGNEDQEKQE